MEATLQTPVPPVPPVPPEAYDKTLPIGAPVTVAYPSGHIVQFSDEATAHEHAAGRKRGYNDPTQRTAIEKQIADLQKEVNERQSNWERR